MIRFQNVNSILQGRTVLADINFQIEDGEWVVLTGGNGSGKSTLCSLAAGLRLPDSGSVEIERAVVEGAVPVSIAMQNPDSQFVTTAVKREIHFGMENIGLPSGIKEERFRESVNLFEIQELLDRNPHTLSGGEKQRLLLASVWVMNPRHLILDEPLTFLDAASRSRVAEAVRKHFYDEGRAVLWATLDRSEIEYADRVLVLDSGSITGYRDPDEFFESGPEGIVVSSEKPSPPRPVSARNEEAESLVEMEEVTISHPESGFSLQIDRLDIRRGEAVGITGQVGSGKSTLLASCAGLIPPNSGTVRIFGKKVESLKDFQAQRVAVLFQTPEEGFFAENVEEEVALGYRSFHGDKGAGEAVREAMETAGIDYETFRKRSPHRLSQGEKRLCALASIIILRAELYILDEPSLFLDADARDRLERALRQLISPDTAVIIASHDSDLISRLTDRTIELCSPGEAPGGISEL